MNEQVINYTTSSLPGEATEPRPEITVIDSPTPVTDSVEFWLNFPIEARPLKFIPGRNRKEKRAFRKLASQAERGTISKGHPKGGGGNLKRLRGMLQLFQGLGIAKMAPTPEGEKK